VAVQQAAGLGQRWRTNRRQAARRYVAHLAGYTGQPGDNRSKQRQPTWTAGALPELKSVCIQANVNGVAGLAEVPAGVPLQPSVESQFDSWLPIATLSRRKPVYLPVKLSDYPKHKLAGVMPNSSVTLHRRKGVWWLTLTLASPQPERVQAVRRRGVDVAIVNFLTDDRGQRYGTFKGDLARRHQADRAKRQRQAKLRACLDKQGVQNLPSTSSASGQRLARHVRQSINRAVNLLLDDNADSLLVMEDLDVSSMRFKARRMNAYLYASNLGHIPEQLRWAAATRGIPLAPVNPAYASQECPRCPYADRANRPHQQTFCCQVCGYAGHADALGATNLLNRYADQQLARCRSLEQVKHLVLTRHSTWTAHHAYP
jgi:IS605 OrfB family transposase